ncbi:MAG: pentapeptide repeat-containing protein [Planctomycetales bacterium]|nr:pentapeptide repeat-containing protein [Planctomycetales bacterium]MCA9166024.1 pentapeptide repeat-containing protein [Planctomycetales bacterium]
MNDAHPNLVRPRVVSQETHEAILLEDIIASHMAPGACKVVELVGPAGSGKSTALKHLASLSFPMGLQLIDDLGRAETLAPSDTLSVYTTRVRFNQGATSYRLASWTLDDVIEYVLATAPRKCSSAIARLSADPDRVLLEGIPALLCLVVDQFVTNERVGDVRTALRAAIAQRVRGARQIEDAECFAVAQLTGDSDLADQKRQSLSKSGVDRASLRVLQYRFPQTLLCADYVAARLRRGQPPTFPPRRLPRDVLQELASIVASDLRTLRRVRRMYARSQSQYLPTLASILHLADREWRPDSRRRTHLAGAHVAEADWRGVDLSGIDLRESDLSRAVLLDATLNGANLDRAILHGVIGSGARMNQVTARIVDLQGSDLSRAEMSNATLTRANCAGADLSHVIAKLANFRRANFCGASLRAACLEASDFRFATLRDADFCEAILKCANLSDQDLRSVAMTGATLEQAILRKSDLEFVAWERVTLTKADLTGAYLTGSQLPGVDLRHAKLQGAGLADIEWPDADLRGANLRGCAFHMGSSRSGLVDSAYPSHGTRTGFYTNDYEDRSFKSPEEIRKANLCGADFRGAIFEDVDFYLVDLRGAKYDTHQRKHFERCDAILENFVP